MLLIINIINPGYSNVLLKTQIGHLLICVGLGLLIIGAMIIRTLSMELRCKDDAHYVIYCWHRSSFAWLRYYLHRISQAVARGAAHLGTSEERARGPANDPRQRADTG